MNTFKQWSRLQIRRFALWLLWLTDEPEPDVPRAVMWQEIPVTYGPVCGCGRVMPEGSLKMHDGVYRCFKCKRAYKE